MNNKYYDVICILSEIIDEIKKENQWKDFQIEAKDKEITRLKAKLECKEGSGL